MTVKVLYWNCTTPSHLTGSTVSQRKRDVIKEVVRDLAPDILCLDECSLLVDGATSADDFASSVLNSAGEYYDCKAVIENPGVHLNTAVWVKRSTQATFNARARTGIPSVHWDSERTKRDLVEVRFTLAQPPPQPRREFTLFFLHANANTTNGVYACQLAVNHVTTAPGPVVFLGDFNCDVQNGNPHAVHPNVGGLTFTQWKTDQENRGSQTVSRLTDRGESTSIIRYEPNRVIDYAVRNPNLATVNAMDSIDVSLGLHRLADFICQFDHFPVMYDLS